MRKPRYRRPANQGTSDPAERAGFWDKASKNVPEVHARVEPSLAQPTPIQSGLQKAHDIVIVKVTRPDIQFRHATGAQFNVEDARFGGRMAHGGVR